MKGEKFLLLPNYLVKKGGLCAGVLEYETEIPKYMDFR